MGRRRYKPFKTPLIFAEGEHKDLSLVEYYRLDDTEIKRVSGLDDLLRSWIEDQLQQGDGIVSRDHSMKYRLDRYANGRMVQRNGEWYQAEKLSEEDLGCIRHVGEWFREVKDWRVVEVGFSSSLQICKIALNVRLPTDRILFLAIGVDRGLKTFYVNERPKNPGANGFQCTIPGCSYTTASQLFLV